MGFESLRGNHIRAFGIVTMKKTYDRVYSLGQWCATAICLKKLGLRSASGPFDWTGPNVRLPKYLELLRTGFIDFMRKENLRFVEEAPAEGKVHYVDAATGFRSHHEFRIGVPFDAMYDAFRATLDRRIARLLADLSSRRRVLFVHYLGEGHYARADVAADMARLRARFPLAEIDLLVLETETSAPGLAWEEPAPGVRFVVGDFYDRARHDEVMGNEPLCRQALGGIRLRGRLKNLLRLKAQSARRRLARAFGRKARR